MKKQITRISPIQTSKVIALLYFLFSLPFVLIIAVPLFLAPGARSGMSAMIFAFPIFYLIGGFIMTVIMAWIYNFVASKVGGIEFTTEEVESA